MPEIAASISINGDSAVDLLPFTIELEIEEDHDMPSVTHVKLAMHQQDDGTWAYLDDDRVQLWNPISISVTVADDQQELFSGYITEIKSHFDVEDNACYVTICGTDATCLMGLEEKIKDWPNMSDSDIASQILSSYNLTPEVDDSGVVHDDTVSTIIQRETDIHFLKRLARRNGYECVVRGDTGYFRKPVLTDPPLPVLAVLFGADTNVASMDVEVKALQPMAVEMHQIDVIGKQTEDASIDTSDQTQLGQNSVLTLTVPNGVQPRSYVRHAVATGVAEMQNLCQAIYDRAEWLVEATGHVDSIAYGTFLRSLNLVPIKGLGQLFSGMYYLTNVRHVITVDHYLQHFKARRNAMAPKDSDFASPTSLF
jgi:phage protein D